MIRSLSFILTLSLSGITTQDHPRMGVSKLLEEADWRRSVRVRPECPANLYRIFSDTRFGKLCKSVQPPCSVLTYDDRKRNERDRSASASGVVLRIAPTEPSRGACAQIVCPFRRVGCVVGA